MKGIVLHVRTGNGGNNEIPPFSLNFSLSLTYTNADVLILCRHIARVPQSLEKQKQLLIIKEYLYICGIIFGFPTPKIFISFCVVLTCAYFHKHLRRFIDYCCSQVMGSLLLIGWFGFAINVHSLNNGINKTISLFYISQLYFALSQLYFANFLSGKRLFWKSAKS